MQLKIYIDLKNTPLTLPINYLHILQGIIYHSLDDKKFGSKLHDSGLTDIGNYKFFTFSSLCGKHFIKDKEIIFTDKIFFDKLQEYFNGDVRMFMRIVNLIVELPNKVWITDSDVSNLSFRVNLKNDDVVSVALKEYDALEDKVSFDITKGDNTTTYFYRMDEEYVYLSKKLNFKEVSENNSSKDKTRKRVLSNRITLNS